MWFPFALTFALVSSLGSIIAKRIMREADEYLFVWLSFFFTVPLLFLTIIILYQIPSFDITFIKAVSVSVFLDAIAAVLAYRAIKISEISLVAPLSALNPVFTSIVSFITLGEKITVNGAIGIFLICIGAYILQISKIKKGWFNPIKVLLQNPGVRLSLVAYFIWAITPIFQKTAILHTSPQTPPFVGLAGLIGQTFVFTFLVTKFSRIRIKVVKKFLPLFILGGVLGVVANISAFTAFSLTNLGFATAVFKLSMIFTIIWGWLFFKEENIKDKLLGAVVILTGVTSLTY